MMLPIIHLNSDNIRWCGIGALPLQHQLAYTFKGCKLASSSFAA